MEKSPWEVLGVPETSSDEAVKLAWRKLILKCHPDKAAEADKQEKAEEFKKVNEAYKTITEPELRRKYEEDKERKKRFEASGPGPAQGASAASTRHYNTRTAAPSTAYAGSTRDSRPYEYARSPEDIYEENRTSSRKYSEYDHYSSSRRDRDRDSPRTPRTFKESSKAAKESDKASRADRRRRDDRAQKSERKFVYVESDSDERANYEESYHRKSEERRNQDKYAEESSSRRYDDRKHRSRSDKYDDPSKQKYASQADEAKDYISRSQHHERPYPVRRTNSAAVPDPYVRRSSARRERDSERTPRDRRRGSGPEIVDFPTERVIPEFTHSTSSPANIKLRMPPVGRSSSDYPTESKPAPSFRRSETMPTTSRTKDKAAPTSGARLRDPVEDSGYSSPTTPDDVKTSYKYAAYSPHPDGVRPLDDKYRTVLREPYEKSSRRKSPSPARTTRGARYTASPITPTGRSQSYRVVEPSSSSEDLPRPPLYSTVRHTQPRSFRDVTNNGRNNSDGEPLFGEIRGEARSRYDPNKVSYARKIDVNDINYGYASRNMEREGHRPSMYRSSTTAY